MAEKSLGQLLHMAGILQPAAKLTGNFGELNDVILSILRLHLDEVQVQFAPKRPHAWDHHLAVLQVKYGRSTLSLPVPELIALDRALSNKVRNKMSKQLEFNASEAVEFFSSLKNWDQGLTVSMTVSGAEMTREFMIWLADLGEEIAEKHPHVEIIAFAKRWHSFPRGLALCTDTYSGHNFAGGPTSAETIAENLRYRATQDTVPVCLQVTVVLHTGGARFNWELAAGMSSPTPIFVDDRDSGDVVWTPKQALEWARKNWRSNVTLPKAILKAIYETYGLGTKGGFRRSDGEDLVWYSITPEDIQPEGWTPPKKWNLEVEG